MNRKELLTLASSLGITVYSNASTKSKGKKLVRVFLRGGFSHIDSFDPKEPKHIAGNTKSITGNTGEQLSEFFPNLSRMMDKFSLIRSMNGPEGDHARGQYLMDSSYPLLGTIKHPSLGAWMTKLNGTMNPTIPSFVTIGSKTYSGGFFGSDYDSFKVVNAKDALKGLILEDHESEDSQDFLRLLKDVRSDFHKEYKFNNTDSYRLNFNNAMKLIKSRDLDAFDISKESEKGKKLYSIPLGENFLLARRLLESDVQYISIDVNGWDNHRELWEDNNYPTKAKNLDLALATFFKDLYDRGLQDEVVVNVISEFGRTPVVNQNSGRDHWRKTYTSIVMGAGVKNGIIYGKTDETGESIVENPVTPMDLNRTLAHLVGLNTEKEVFSPDNRPFTVVRGGEVVKGILA